MLNNSSSSLQPSDEFRKLFGVLVPAGADMAAVAEMIKRRKAGKLSDLKSPLAYLGALAGKVAGTGPTFPVDPVPAAIPMIDQRFDEMKKMAIDKWWALPDETRNIYIDRKRSTVKTNGRYTPPYETLAKNEFIMEQCRAVGIQI